jgi:hypothetical protein
MKKKNKQKKAMPRSKKRGWPTLLEFLASYYSEANKQFGTKVEIDSALNVSAMPAWAKKIMTQFGKTIIKPVLKLRPSKKSTCQDYGKLTGMLNRGITFYREDAWKMIEAEGLDEISDEKWEMIQPSDQLRAHVVKQLGRPVADTETLEDLGIELIEKRIKHLEELRTRAFQFMSQRSAKENAMFHKGMAQGYEIFMDQDGQFCGDRGRTEIYLELISSLHEIEKMRRMLPSKKDSDLYEHLKPWYRFPNRREDGMAWLRDVCDDISLYMTDKRGRPPGPRHALAF